MQDIITDIIKIKNKIPDFLEHQKNKEINGYYSYSYSGDLYEVSKKWNIPGSLFAADIAYVIGDNECINCNEVLDYLSSFQKENGYIYSNLIRRGSLGKNLLGQIKSGKLTDLNNKKYIRAETRQVFRTLNVYNYPISRIPEREILKGKEVNRFLDSLNWNKPWEAGSHFSHLVFFEKLAYQNGYLTQSEYETAINESVNYVERLWREDVGAWGKGSVSLQQYINGAMKILTGLELIETYRLSEEKALKITELCLNNMCDAQGCDNYNVIYILTCTQKILKDYQASKINQYAEQKFEKYMEFYYPDLGGFSFYPKHANEYYYGFHISEGKNEPDMHGTRMFLWGIDLIAQLLGIESEVGLRKMKE